ARHSAVNRLPNQLNLLQQTWDRRPAHIALILPLKQATGNAIQEGFLSAYYQALDISREVPRISVYDSSNVTSVYGIYDEAVASGADLVIGPLDKQLVNQLAELPELPIKTLALNYSDSAPADRLNLFQFGLAPEDEIAQAIQLAWNAGHRNAAIVTPQSEDYLQLKNFFAESWLSRGGELVSQETFSGDSDYADVIKRLVAIDSSEARADRLLDLLPRNNMEFTPRRREDIDFIFLIANPRQGRQIKPTLAFYFAGNIPVYAMPSIYDGQTNQSENSDLEGIVFTVEPWVLNEADDLKIEIGSNLRQAQGPLQRLRAMGIDSFRLYPRLDQLANRGLTALQGTTGNLTMSEERRIRRVLEVARFEDGLARQYREESADSGS
ncbi:MAG: penicillin-binding protein activator, partial [Gammaproteobacteria bacterium]|nr:penicillin-binding protein activator [Gammaproteobacteria bacterium]